MSANALPVEAVLKLVLDKGGQQSIQDFLDNHTRQWSQVDRIVGRIGDNIEGLSRTLLNLGGIAGVGGLIHNVMQTSEAGSNLALSAGRVTGGSGVWHPYGQAMLSAQAKTGIAATDITAGLIQAIQAAGGTPTPQQAAIVGALLAGYGQTVGLNPSQVAGVLGPMLQAANQHLSSGNAAGMLANVQGGLWAFPGSQAAPMLGLVSQLTLAQGLGMSGTGGTLSPNGLANITSAARANNGVFASPSVLGAATQGVTAGLQGAYSNPSAEAFMSMAGISYNDQRAGLTRQNVQKIMAYATAQYGTGPTRDMVLRSLFGGIPGADLLETLAPGTKGASDMWSHHGITPSQLQHTIGHAQKRTTPNATAESWGAKALGWIEQDIPHMILGALGIAVGPRLLGGVAKAGVSAIGDALGAISGDAATGFAGGGPLGAIAAAIGGSLIWPASIGSTPQQPNSYMAHAANLVEARAKAKFGSHWKSQRNWMQQQIYGGMSPVDVFGANSAEDPSFKLGLSRAGAGSLLDHMLGDQFAAGGSPIDKFSRATDRFSQVVDRLTPGHFTSYSPGSGGLGTPAASALGASSPGALEFVSLQSGASASASAVSGLGSAAAFVSSTTAGGSGWSACTLTWYDPALGGTNSGNGQPNPHSPTASGTPYSASAMTCAAPPSYAFGTRIQFSYAGKTVTCTVNDRGGAIQGAHFDLSRGAAQALGMIAAGRVSAQYRTVGHAPPASNGGGGGAGGGLVLAAAPSSAAGGASAPGLLSALGAAPAAGHAAMGALGAGGTIHLHVYIDGQKQRAARIKAGHHR